MLCAKLLNNLPPPPQTWTAGMTAILVMMHLCDTVTLYEMVPSDKSINAQWHYWQGGHGNATPPDLTHWAFERWHKGEWYHKSKPLEECLWKSMADDFRIGCMERVWRAMMPYFGKPCFLDSINVGGKMTLQGIRNTSGL